MACLKGDVIVTINDHPEKRRLFDRFEDKTVPIKYTIGTGSVSRRERIYVTA
jgi:DNA adenine methylase